MKIANYIIEQASGENLVRNYIKTMESMLYTLLYDVSRVQLGSSSRKLLEGKVKELIYQGTDFSVEREQHKFLKQVRIPLGESVIPTEAANQLSKESKSWFSSFIGMIPDSFKSKTGKSVIGGLIVAAILATVSIKYKAAQKRKAINRQLKNIVDSDINPLIMKVVHGVIHGKIKSETQIRNITSDIESAILKKHFNQRDEY